MVTMSTPTAARSISTARTSSSVSPIPTIRPDFVTRPRDFERASTERLRAYPALGRTACCRRGTVSTLWFITSGDASNRISRE